METFAQKAASVLSSHRRYALGQLNEAKEYTQKENDAEAATYAWIAYTVLTAIEWAKEGTPSGIPGVKRNRLDMLDDFNGWVIDVETHLDSPGTGSLTDAVGMFLSAD